MKLISKLLVVAIGLAAGFVLPVSSVLAHSDDKAPFFKINGVDSDLYPVPTISAANFILPLDLAKENYLVGKPIAFEIDTAPLSLPFETVQKTTYTWDFGDGESAQGLKNTHTYTKVGSYILTIHAQYDQVSGKQLFQSVLLNVLPSSDYQLPKAKILVNGKTSSDPLVDVLRFPYGSELTFDASDSSAPSSKIVEYFWDFGDSQTSGEAKTTHVYSSGLTQQQVFPVLRVTDENGFIADAFLEIDRQGPAPFGLKQSFSANKQSFSANSKKALFVLGGIGIVLAGGAVVLAYRKK